MNTKKHHLLAIPYYLWIILFVIAPILLLYRSFFNIAGQFTFDNYIHYFTNRNYLVMTASSFLYAFLVTLVTLVIAYPMAYFLTKTKRKDFVAIVDYLTYVDKLTYLKSMPLLGF